MTDSGKDVISRSTVHSIGHRLIASSIPGNTCALHEMLSGKVYLHLPCLQIVIDSGWLCFLTWAFAKPVCWVKPEAKCWSLYLKLTVTELLNLDFWWAFLLSKNFGPMLRLAVLLITVCTNLQLVSTSRMHLVMLTCLLPETAQQLYGCHIAPCARYGTHVWVCWMTICYQYADSQQSCWR